MLRCLPLPIQLHTQRVLHSHLRLLVQCDIITLHRGLSVPKHQSTAAPRHRLLEYALLLLPNYHRCLDGLIAARLNCVINRAFLIGHYPG